MTRCVLRAMDFGASVIFMAFCAKALLAYFYKDLRLQQKQQRLAVFKDAPSLMQCLRTQSRSGNCCLYRLNQRRIIRVCLRAVDALRYWPALHAEPKGT